MAAAAPPSAITVCALPNNDFEIIAVRLPASRASIAARSPAPPAPITTTSYCCRSMLVIAVRPLVEEAQVGDPACGDSHDVRVGEDHREKGRHRVRAVPRVELGHEVPEPVAQRVLGEMLEPTADDMPAGMAGKRVSPQHHQVNPDDHRTETDAEAAVLTVERDHRVVRIDEQQDRGEEEEVPMEDHDDQREAGLAGVLLVRLGH